MSSLRRHCAQIEAIQLRGQGIGRQGSLYFQSGRTTRLAEQPKAPTHEAWQGEPSKPDAPSGIVGWSGARRVGGCFALLAMAVSTSQSRHLFLNGSLT
jgi:hypothetical protein